MKQKFLLILLALLISVLTSALDLPLEEEEYLYKNCDITNMGMGFSKVALSNNYGMDTNPATMTDQEDPVLMLGYSYYEPKSVYYYSSRTELTRMENQLDYVSYSYSQGGIYFKRLDYGEERDLSTSHKYNFSLNEIGLSVAQESETLKGLSTGLTIKMYAGQVMEGSVEDNDIDLITDRGYGASFDIGFKYQREFVSLGLTWEDVFGKIFWGEYDSGKINGELNFGLGLTSDLAKYGFSVKKILIDTTEVEFGHGVELRVLSLPEKYSNYMLKGLKAKVRMGTYGESFFGDNNKYTYGFEVENNRYILMGATVSPETNPFSEPDLSVYRATIGYKF